MNLEVIVRPSYTKFDYLKSILFLNFIIASSGTLYYKRYNKNKNEFNPYFLLLLCYTGIYLNSIYMLPINWDRLIGNNFLF